MRRFIKLPSPAMVVAAIALFVAMGGVSYGLASGSINSREIKNGTVRGKDVRNGSLTGFDVKPGGIGGGSVNEGSLGTVPSAESISHTAVVTAGGQLARGKGVSSVARTSTGRYQVIFNRDVRGCVYVASVGDASAAGPPAGTASVTSLPSNVNGVAVRTVDYTGAGDAVANKPFHLIASC